MAVLRRASFLTHVFANKQVKLESGKRFTDRKRSVAE